MEEYVEYFWKHTTELVHHDDEISNYTGTLYQYTNINGLMGILESQRIWGTEYTYLNDSMELSYGLNLVIEVIDQLKQINYSYKWINEWFSLLRIYVVNRPEELYVSCFSEVGDQLSQWKGYGDFGKGFSIGFTTSELSRSKRKFPYCNIRFGKVIYNTLIQKKIVNDEINSTIKSISDYYTDINHIDLLSESARALAYFLRNKAIFFKSSLFEEEREWRCIYINSERSEEKRQLVKFRTNNNVLIPFMELDIGPSAQKRNWALPITEIIVGSKNDMDKIERCITILYKSKVAKKPDIRKSIIPLQ